MVSRNVRIRGDGITPVQGMTVATGASHSGNYILYSEQLNNAAWVDFSAGVTTTTDYAANPIDGAVEAERVLSNTASSLVKGKYQQFAVTSGTTYTFLIYFKPNSSSAATQFSFGNTGFPDNQRYNWYNNGTNAGINELSGTQTALSGGWYRITITATADATTTTDVGFTFYNTTAPAYRAANGAGTSFGGSFWGAQLVPTNNTSAIYVETTNSTVAPANTPVDSVLVLPEEASGVRLQAIDGSIYVSTNDMSADGQGFKLPSDTTMELWLNNQTPNLYVYGTGTLSYQYIIPMRY